MIKSFESNLLKYTSTGNITLCIVNEEYQHFRVPSELKTQLKMGKQNYVYLQNESIPIMLRVEARSNKVMQMVVKREWVYYCFDSSPNSKHSSLYQNWVSSQTIVVSKVYLQSTCNVSVNNNIKLSFQKVNIICIFLKYFRTSN